jgi:hypothetical protein
LLTRCSCFRFDADRVADELVAPAFVVLEDSAAAKVTGDRLQKGFSNRASDLVDYCIRHYQGTGKGFVVRPDADHEAKCAQVRVELFGAILFSAPRFISFVLAKTGGGLYGSTVAGGVLWKL